MLCYLTETFNLFVHVLYMTVPNISNVEKDVICFCYEQDLADQQDKLLKMNQQSIRKVPLVGIDWYRMIGPIDQD